jgi:hypothetical protein
VLMLMDVRRIGIKTGGSRFIPMLGNAQEAVGETDLPHFHSE